MKRRQFIERIGFLGLARRWNCEAYQDCWRMHLPTPDLSESKPAGQTALAIHPDNPKYFLFRGRPLVLLAASEHYGSIVNRRFDFERYLNEAATTKQTRHSNISAVSRELAAVGEKSLLSAQT